VIVERWNSELVREKRKLEEAREVEREREFDWWITNFKEKED
jgi:hypothetical protein